MKLVRYIQSVTTFLLLAASVAGAQIVPFATERTENSLRMQTASYSIEVGLAGFSLYLSRSGVVRAGAPEGAGFYILRDGKRLPLGAVKNVRETPEGVFLVAGAGGGPDVRVSLRPYADNIHIRCETVDGAPCAQMGLALSLGYGGHWYGGNITSGHIWPLESGSMELDPFLATSNQTVPLWLCSSGAGVFVPTYRMMGFSINRGSDGLFRLNVKNTPALDFRLLAGEDIVRAYDAFTRLAGRPRTTPPLAYFESPIFNTWIELKITVNQEDVLAYARTLREQRFPAEIFMIDDRWQRTYGDHEFDAEKFRDPGAMIEQLHGMGLRVILWVVPFVHLDAHNYSLLEKRGWLVMDETGKRPCRVEWWNGVSSLVDFSNPDAFDWFVGELRSLQARYGVDGFKLDGGDAEYFDPSFRTRGNVTPNEYTDLFARAGSNFAINEYRVSWLVQELGLVQRLRDKNNNWSRESGLGSLVPHGLTECMTGYPYFCPDIIGGGLDGDFRPGRFGGMDPELFVRWTQASCLMPMMQFSFAPWNLDEPEVSICREYADLHREMSPYIYGLALDARRTGRPVIAPLFFRNPDDDAAYSIGDQFMLGDKYLVAPVLEKGAAGRDIYLPAGLWRDYWDGSLHEGGRWLRDYPAPLETLPLFESLEGR